MKIELLGRWSCADQSIKTAEVMRELDGTMVAVLQAALCRFEQLHRPGFQNPENFLGAQCFRSFRFQRLEYASSEIEECAVEDPSHYVQ